MQLKTLGDVHDLIRDSENVAKKVSLGFVIVIVFYLSPVYVTIVFSDTAVTLYEAFVACGAYHTERC